VEVLSNSWVRIHSGDVINEHIFFHDKVLEQHVVRLCGLLDINPEYFTEPEKFEEYVRQTKTAPFPLARLKKP
jgi:hypothetical protein